MQGSPLVLVSSNPNKAIEAERILGVPLVRIPASRPEIQARSLEEIARHKLVCARESGHSPVIVEDVSLGFHELGGFPGPYIHWLLQSAGGSGVGTVASALRSRAALAECCVAYWNGVETMIFNGTTEGEILIEPRGPRTFGWDAWFLPQGFERTYAEMAADEKDLVSHRGKAYRQLATHLRKEAARHS
ncbi:MAG TPA: non-canonical purine NTP pyrophosphatase [Thermoanaerobaculia bacterium]|nr:non-canonical purine NTP pyrophosphatase [Thermoanaerobaculia bacterium]